MYAADFMNRVFPDNPGTPVFFEIPFHGEPEVRNVHISGFRVSFTFPVPAITCHHPRFVVCFVFVFDGFSQFIRVTEYPEIEIILR